MITLINLSQNLLLKMIEIYRLQNKITSDSFLCYILAYISFPIVYTAFLFSLISGLEL